MSPESSPLNEVLRDVQLAVRGEYLSCILESCPTNSGYLVSLRWRVIDQEAREIINTFFNYRRIPRGELVAPNGVVICSCRETVLRVGNNGICLAPKLGKGSSLYFRDYKEARRILETVQWFNENWDTLKKGPQKSRTISYEAKLVDGYYEVQITGQSHRASSFIPGGREAIYLIGGDRFKLVSVVFPALCPPTSTLGVYVRGSSTSCDNYIIKMDHKRFGLFVEAVSRYNRADYGE